MVDAAEEQLTALNGIGRLTRQRNDEGGNLAVRRGANRCAYRVCVLSWRSIRPISTAAKATLMSFLGWNSL